MKINKKIIVIIIVIIPIILLCLCVYIEKRVITNKHAEKKVYLMPNEIIDMMSYIPYSMIKFEPNIDAYNGNIVLINDVYPIILSSAFLNQHIDTYNIMDITDTDLKKILSDKDVKDTIYLRKDIENFLLKYYNFNIDFLKTHQDKVKFITAGNEYITFFPNGVKGVSIVTKLFLSVDNTSATNSNAIIKEKVLFYIQKDDKCYIYKNTDFTNDGNIIKVYDKVDVNGNILENKDIDEKIKEDFKDYKGEFIHTFKKNNTGYYWYSTEFVE